MRVIIYYLRKIFKFLYMFYGAPKHLVLFSLELENLHFRPIRKIKKGKGCVVDHQTWLINGQNIILGDHVKISAFSTIMAGYRSKVVIGDNTIIGPSVLIASFNHGFSRSDIPIRYQTWDESPEKSIKIGDDVWIGGNVTILPGTIIETGSIIAAGSIVKGFVPKYTIYLNKKTERIIKRFSH